MRFWYFLQCECCCRSTSSDLIQDEWGNRFAQSRSGTHPTFSKDGVPLFFKATTIGQENSLGAAKEFAMARLADVMWKPGSDSCHDVMGARASTHFGTTSRVLLSPAPTFAHRVL